MPTYEVIWSLLGFPASRMTANNKAQVWMEASPSSIPDDEIDLLEWEIVEVNEVDED